MKVNEIKKIVEESHADKIVDEVGQLPIECQEYILAVMKGMVFTRSILQKEAN